MNWNELQPAINSTGFYIKMILYKNNFYYCYLMLLIFKTKVTADADRCQRYPVYSMVTTVIQFSAILDF